MKRLVILAVFAAAAASARLLPAQIPAATNPELTAALEKLRPGHRVRISAGGVQDTGRVAVASPNQLAFRRRTGLNARTASSIDSLWTWKSNSGSGALVGAVFVGALGAFVGAGLSGMALDYEPSRFRTFKVVAGGSIVGGLLGTLIGGIIGSATSHWELVHPR
jgi:hypothetical protein